MPDQASSDNATTAVPESLHGTTDCLTSGLGESAEPKRPGDDEGKMFNYLSLDEFPETVGYMKMAYKGSTLPGAATRLESLKWWHVTNEVLEAQASSLKGKDAAYKNKFLQTYIEVCKDTKQLKHVTLLPMTAYTADNNTEYDPSRDLDEAYIASSQTFNLGVGTEKEAPVDLGTFADHLLKELEAKLAHSLPTDVPTVADDMPQ